MSATVRMGMASRRSVGEFAGLAAILIGGGIIALLCQRFPSQLPFWMPYEFVWSEYLAITLAAWWYVRGVRRMPRSERPSTLRHVGYGAGLVLTYAVLLTRLDYMAQHMFFISRIQHLVLHHMAPFLIALSWPGKALYRGMPEALRPLVDHRWTQRAAFLLQQPVLAAVLFFGLVDFWLYPPIMFRAMIDPTLYDVMSWSMMLDGLFFWLVMLDPRSAPPARSSFAIRLVTVVVVMLPQIVTGSYLTFTTTDLYPTFELCGRLYPSIGALLDQHYGGLLIWIPASMMSAIAFMLTLNNVRREEEARPPQDMTEQERRMAEMAKAWTGR